MQAFVDTSLRKVHLIPTKNEGFLKFIFTCISLCVHTLWCACGLAETDALPPSCELVGLNLSC